MIFGLILIIHILVCLALIGVILLQSGRGGLSEALGGAAAQSLFGGGARTVLTRITAICASVFVATCLSLAYLSTVRGRSVIEQVPILTPETLPEALGVPRPPETVQGPETDPVVPQAPQPIDLETPATAPTDADSSP